MHVLKIVLNALNIVVMNIILLGECSCEHVTNNNLGIEDNILFGSSTPIFLAKQNLLDFRQVLPTIFYNCSYYRNEKYFSQVIDQQRCISRLASRNKKSQLKTNFTQVSTVYPELLVVVDYATYKRYSENLEALMKYLISFWHGVDLKFRPIKNPEIRLNIASIVIAKEPLAEPYHNDYEDLPIILRNVGNYFNEKISIHHDIVVFMSSRVFRSKNGKKISGGSYTRGACKGNISSAVFHDPGAYAGTLSAAQVLGSLLGAFFDGVNYNSEEMDKIPCCSSKDGYLMGQWSESWNKMHWSNCSINHIQNYLRSEEAECLRNKPIVNHPHEKKLPGKLMSGDTQCLHLFLHSNIQTVKDDCNILHCGKCPDIPYLRWFCFGRYTNFLPPAEGTSCGENSICLNGVCVRDPGTYS